MPHVFPGIDPYVESQMYWRDFHVRFLTYCADALGQRLPDSYYASIDEQVRLVARPDGDEPSRLFLPDVAVVRQGHSTGRRARVAGAAVLEVEAEVGEEPVIVPAAFPEEARERYLKIVHRPDRRLVAVIELLSPSNKVEPGFSDYVSKRAHLLREPVHLVEFDFLNGGHRLPMEGPLPPGHYYVVVARADRRPDCEVYARSVRQALPRVKVPLLAPDPDVVLDLGEVVATVYDQGPYARAVDYAAPLDVGFGPEDRDWAEAHARAAIASAT